MSQYAQQHGDDGVHRIVVRTGKSIPPEDPDEQVYDRDEGEHADIARKALQAQDFKRAIYHLGLALAEDPLREEWLALLDQWITATGSRSLDLVPLNDDQYFATMRACQTLMRQGNTPTHRMEVTPVVGKNYHARIAVHAYILATQGRMKEAADLLLQLNQVKPEIPYVRWLLRWQDQPGFADALKPEQIASLVMLLMRKYPGTYVFSEQSRSEISRYLPLLYQAYLTLSNEQTGESFSTVGFVYSMALRKTGAFEEAARIARELPTTSYQAQTALAMAESALGNLDAAIAAYRQALTIEPDDVAARNDLGELFLNQGNIAEALAVYEESTRLDPSDPYQDAFARVAYLKHLQNPSSEEWLDRLFTLAQSQRSARRFIYLLQAPYIGQLPYPGEALINIARSIKDKIIAGEIKSGGGSNFSVGLSSLESPSAWLAEKLMLAAWGISCELGVSDVLSPDPRQPLRPVEYQVWRYEGFNPIPAVAPPDPAIAESIAAIARTPYALERWHAPARELGQRLGTGALMDLLGVMVHPPATPQGWHEWDWLIAVQIASALTLAYIDDGWEGSRRKAALLSLVYGPMDWVGAAALIAIALLARQDMRIHIEFDRICCDLWHFGRGSAEWPHEQAMIYGLLFLDSYSAESAQYISAYFEEMSKSREQQDQ